ncbi:hypothetical protein [Actinomadura madurae]|uniref:hypothetical protein n=1 Tax=Actinomadura madurae TaxID=1993 RepID=UPI001160C470|nr:hypothetical protein [Actinomadura madurae]
MNRTHRVALWGGVGLVGLIVVALATFYAISGLDKADKTASVVSSLIGVIALGVAIFAIFQTYTSTRGRGNPNPTQTQRSGSNSVNLQAGNDMQIGDNSRFH